MAAAASSTQPSILTHVFRVRPTTVDQKRTLPRNQRRATTANRPSTTEPKIRVTSSKLSNHSVTTVETDNDANESILQYEDSTLEQNLDNNNNLLKPRNNADIDDIDSPVGSDYEVDINDEEKWDTDIEADEEKPKDFSCQGIYLEACKKQKVIPASYFLRHLNDPVLTMKHHGLGVPGIKPVSAALVTNTKVTTLDVSDNWLGPTGTDALSKMMKDNCYIYDLNVSDNHLGVKGAEIMNDMLRQNTTLTHLTLQGNNFDDNAAATWADIIANNARLEFLDLSHNNFGETSGKLLGPAISENTSLKHLILSWNNIRRKGAIAIAKGLQTNIILKKFDISWNGISTDGAKALLKTLKENEVLEELDISNNRISTEGAVYISKGLSTNQALRVLKMGKNPMESAGCFAIIKGLQKNQTTKIEEIDFSDIIVDKFYFEELKEFKELYPQIRIKTGVDETKLKPKVRLHPIVKLKNYIDKHHIKLIDFFNKFDKDGSMNVSREEFIQGLEELGIHLEADEIQLLINDLDADGDGEINYSEVAVGYVKYSNRINNDDLSFS